MKFTARMDGRYSGLDKFSLNLKFFTEYFCGKCFVQVFQRRFDGSVDFQVGWDAYVNGFGNKSGEFWLGLRKIHQLTEVEGCRLRVDLKDFEGNQAYAEYRSFSVANEDDLFRIRVSGYSGSADDDLRHHDYHVFSTFDRDNDPYSGANCATLKGRGQGGWWFHGSCYHCALNAAWGRSEGSYHNIVWQDWKGPRHALQATTMKLRCD
ncbi:unnamed protein product [Clavelina lepadiformis]|uniref:Fibrinogen C-terminal domain-containing protein n=1 Tax=Clavelina lepadiformis TaxID=159417 RepID=A0ABP0FN51_CLALP